MWGDNNHATSTSVGVSGAPVFDVCLSRILELKDAKRVSCYAITWSPYEYPASADTSLINNLNILGNP